MGEEMNLILIMFKIQADMSGRYWKTRSVWNLRNQGQRDRLGNYCTEKLQNQPPYNLYLTIKYQKVKYPRKVRESKERTLGNTYY